jgi:hypothetical protein
MTKSRIPVNGYSDHIIVFIDVLGFSDAIKKSPTSPENYNKVSSLLVKLKELAIRKTQETHSGDKIPHITISSFSDSIIISCSIVSELSFNLVLLIMCEFCMTTVLEHGFFLRGALTIGPFQENEGTMFGPALVRAYEIERSLALWPRCVIDPTLLARADIYPDGVWKKHQYILLGSDGLPFIDYLGFPIAGYFYRWIEGRANPGSHEQDENPEDVALKVLHQHKVTICQAVQNAGHNEEIASSLFTKFYPLAAYHNRVIGRFALDFTRPGRLDDIKKFASEKGYDPAIVDILDAEIIKEGAPRWRSELIDLDSMFTIIWGESFVLNNGEQLNNL